MIAVAVAIAAATGCGGGDRYDREDLPKLVLGRDDAPQGTFYVDGSSGYRPLDEYAEDKAEEDAYRAAGFTDAFFAEFLSPRLFRDEGTLSGDPNAALAFSFGLLFRDVNGARRGLALVDDDVRRDGKNLQERPTTGLPSESLVLGGTLDPSLPPGFLFAWRRGNGVFGLVAAGAPGVIDERAARELAFRMLKKA